MFIELNEKLDDKGRTRPIVVNVHWIAAIERHDKSLYGGNRIIQETAIILAIPKDSKGTPHAAKHYDIAESFEDVVRKAREAMAAAPAGRA